MKDLATVIQSVQDGHPRKEEVQEMISEVDFDGNGSIEFLEFLNIMGRKMKVTTYVSVYMNIKLIKLMSMLVEINEHELLFILSGKCF